jgi:hypothetical protein
MKTLQNAIAKAVADMGPHLGELEVIAEYTIVVPVHTTREFNGRTYPTEGWASFKRPAMDVDGHYKGSPNAIDRKTAEGFAGRKGRVWLTVTSSAMIKENGKSA